MEKNKTIEIDFGQLEISKKQQARIGIITGATICAIIGGSALLLDAGKKLKKKYTKWKIIRCSKKLLKDPRLDEDIKEQIKAEIKKIEELD